MKTRQFRPYVDRSRRDKPRFPGAEQLRVTEPSPVKHIILQLKELRRHNSLHPEIQPTHRVFLRWVESGGTGIPNPEADKRELHFDPLPPDQEKLVTKIVENSPWDVFIPKVYVSTLDTAKLAELLGMSKTKFHDNWRCALWYFKGRFEEVGLFG